MKTKIEFIAMNEITVNVIDIFYTSIPIAFLGCHTLRTIYWIKLLKNQKMTCLKYHLFLTLYLKHFLYETFSTDLSTKKSF
jgi:hypothetical protein